MGKSTSGVEKCFSFTKQTGDKTLTECNYCGATWAFKVTGTKGVAHILDIKKQSIQPCSFSKKKLEEDVRQKLVMSTKGAREQQHQQPKFSFGGSGGEPEAQEKRGVKRLFTDSHKTNANLLLSHAIALHGMTSWRFCNSPAFGDFVKYVAENMIAGYKPADRHTLSGPLFGQLISRQDKDVEEADDDSLWATIYNDGYETKAHRHTMNSLIATRQGVWFLDSRHVTIEEGGSLNKAQMEQVMAADVAAVGEERVCGYVLDSPNVNVGALRGMEAECRRICGILCQTHQWSLVISKILKLPMYKKQVQGALVIAKFFRRVLFAKALFSALQFSEELKSQYSGAPSDDGYAILLFAKTRMGGVYFMLQRLIFLKPVLQACVVHPKFTEKYGPALAELEHEEVGDDGVESSDDELDLPAGESASKEKRKMLRIKEAKKLILDETWWSAVKMTCSLLSEPVAMMKMTDHAHFLTGKMRDMWLKGQVQPSPDPHLDF